MGRAPSLIGSLLVLALLSGCQSAAISSSSSGGGSEMTGTVLDPPFRVDGTPLLDGDGAAYSLSDDTDKDLTLVFFGYIHCDDICGTVMSTMASAMARLSDEERADVDVVFVTTDPSRDTPALVKDYAARYDPEFIGLTGPIATIIDVAQPLGIAVEQGDKLPSGGYEVTHGTQIVAIDSGDEGVAYWNEDVSSAQLAADVQHLLNERS